MFSILYSSFGPTEIISWCHIYYITSVILYIFSGYVTASEYYVSAAPNGLPCPTTTDLPCHNLSYYVAEYHSYFTDDTILYFLEGTHTLQGILEITNISNITLQGQGHIEHGFHGTVMQSTSVIMCSHNKRAAGIQFTTSKSIVMKSLTIANCAFDAYIYDQEITNSLQFVDIKYVTLEWLSVQNGSGYGLSLVNNFDVLIANSSFANNGHPETIGGNAYIYFDDQLKNLSRVNIMQSNFSLSLRYALFLMFDSDAEVIIENSEFSHNIGGGVFTKSQSYASIEFHSCTIHNNNNNNNVKYYNGGGVLIDSYGNVSIGFNNCTIHNNTAQYGGGGMYIDFHGNGNIEFHDCTISNNTAQNFYGGGVLIDLYGNGSIEFHNCTIHNNTAVYGGGMHIYSHNGSIELHNCTIYNNTVQNTGGGVYINLYGSGRFEFHHCTIHNNIAQKNEGGGGGGAYIYSDNGSIEFNNCTLYSNTVQNAGGGGVFIESLGNSMIEFLNCTVYINTAQRNGGGVHIYAEGSSNITFSNCTIYNNTAHLAGGGGVYIYSENGVVEFNNCTIYSNTVQHAGGGVWIESFGNGSIDFLNSTVYINTAKRYGGGVYIYSDRSGGITFSNCTIYNNSVQYAGGGGVYIYSISGSIEFNNCTINNNTVQHAGGGGVLIESFGNSSINFCNCTIYINTAQKYGGGVYIYSNGSGSFKFNNCVIYNNTAYFGSGLLLYAHRFTSTASFLFTNVSFHFNHISDKNDVYQAAVVIVNIYYVIFNKIEVSNHNMTGLVSFNSVITFKENSIFVNNAGIYGGGIALYESSQLLLKNQAYIYFVNNHASKSGGGIFVSQVLVEDIYITCSFQIIFPNVIAWLYFVNNTANISGDVLYGGKIDNCSFDDLFYYHQQTGLSVVSSDPIQVCFCVSDKPNCSISNMNITAMPGIDVNISLATVGSKDGLTKGVIKLTSSDSSSIVQIDNNRLNATCTNITFKLTANPYLLNATNIYATLENSIIDPLKDHRAKVIHVTIESCPIGFPLMNDTCVCRSELNTPRLTCDINTQIITRDGNMWIGYKNNSDCLIVYQNCPFDYCNDNIIHFKVTSPNTQCLYNRSGLLCGQCAEGLSLMLGSNHCGQCTDNYLALIIPFAVAGIALVAFVIVLNVTVSVGTINGLIFYANLIKIYEPIFFCNGRIPFLSHFISWLNLDLGIETCFYHGMNSCYKTWLQFIFPGYVWFLVILIIMLSQYSSKVVRLVGRQAIPVLATMILLSYTKLTRTVFQILHYTNMQCRGNSDVTLLRWYNDANIQYLRGCHLPLFIFSLAVLILLIVPYTFYLLTIPLLEGPLSKYMCCCQKLIQYMKPFFDAYGGPYKDKCRFWTGFLLLVRVVLALVVSLDTEATISLDVLTSVLFVIVSLYFLLRGIYQKLPLAFLEMSFILNLMFMTYVNVSKQSCENSKSNQVLRIAMVSVSCVVFCGIILYHVCDQILKSHLQQLITRVKRILKKPSPFFNSDDAEIALMRPGSPSIICETSSVSVVSVKMRREPLLFDEDD